MKPKHPAGPSMTLGNLRELDALSLPARDDRWRLAQMKREQLHGPPMTLGKLRREKGTSIAPMPGAHASYRRGPGCLWAKAGSRL